MEDLQICMRCDKEMLPQDEHIVLEGAPYHAHCAKCEECGCQITLINFTFNRVNNEFLCKTHYIRKFLADGGQYGAYKPRHAFEELLRNKIEKQRAAEAAHRAAVAAEEMARSRQERDHAISRSYGLVSDSTGNLVDIDAIFASLNASPSKDSAGEVLEIVDTIALDKKLKMHDDDGRSRSLKVVKEFVM